MHNVSSLFNALPIVAAHYGSKFGVKVKFADKACTDGETIYLPKVNESFNRENPIWGYLVHEAAHVRYSDMSVLDGAISGSKFRYGLFQVIEDARIEKKIMNQFPGAAIDLVHTVQYMQQQNILIAGTESDEPHTIFLKAVLYELRSKYLNQESLIELCGKTSEVLGKVFPSGVCTRLHALLRRLSTLQGSEDSLVLADDIIQMLEDERENDRHNEDEESEEGVDSSDGNASSEDSISQTLDAQCVDDSDIFKQLAGEIQSSGSANHNSDYCDVPADPCCTGEFGANVPYTSSSPVLLDDVYSASRRLRRKLLSLVQSNDRRDTSPKAYGRKVDGRRVTRLLSGDTKIFRARSEKVTTNAAVHILVDMSSSMRGHAEQVARNSALSIALALDDIPHVSPAVTYFFRSSDDPIVPVVKHGQSVKNKLADFSVLADGTTPMAEAIWYAGFELSKRTESRKILLAISDGKPNNGDACRTVLCLCDKAGIEQLGIGISRHQKISNYFDNHIVIDSVDELGNTIFSLMRKTLVGRAA